MHGKGIANKTQRVERRGLGLQRRIRQAQVVVVEVVAADRMVRDGRLPQIGDTQ